MARVVALAILLIAVLVPPAAAYVCTGIPDEVCHPVPPSVFKAQTMSDGIHMSWGEPMLAEGAIKNYVIHRTHLESGDHQHFNAGLELSYVDVPPEEGVYVYYVTAEYEEGSGSLPSNPFIAYWPPWPHCQPASVFPQHVNADCFRPLPLAG